MGCGGGGGSTEDEVVVDGVQGGEVDFRREGGDSGGGGFGEVEGEQGVGGLRQQGAFAVGEDVLEFFLEGKGERVVGELLRSTRKGLFRHQMNIRTIVACQRMHQQLLTRQKGDLLNILRERHRSVRYILVFLVVRYDRQLAGLRP